MSIENLRRELIQLIAVSNDVKAVALALRGKESDVTDMAKELGVTPKLLSEAIFFAREGFGGAAEVGSIVTVDLFIPNDVYVCVDQIAYMHKMNKPKEIIRSLVHVAMQQESEPNERKKWKKALPGSESIRAKLTTIASKRDPRKYINIGYNGKVHLYISLTKGLLKAVDMRATAFGTTRTRYILLWVSDLVDGKLMDWHLPRVGDGQMFDNERLYVIPSQFAKNDAPAGSDDAPAP